MDSIMIHVDSAEGKEQLAEDERRQEAEEANIKRATDDKQMQSGDGGDSGAADAEAGADELETKSADAGTGTDDNEAGDAAGGDDDDADGGRALKNQFNFSERASQTFNNHMRDHQVATEPPPTGELNENATQWQIFDAYVESVLRQMLEKEQADQKSSRIGRKQDKAGLKKPDVVMREESDADASASSAQAVIESPSLVRSVKIMERLVNQNADNQTYHHYKYFSDEADGIREDGRGSFLPLWRFTFPIAKRKTVTSLRWNPKYADLFAVGYGSYDFMKQGPGLVCCYSLKNTSHPEFVFTTESGVMCMDFHPHFSSLLAVGLYDGTVCVFDVRSKEDKPLYTSSDPSSKHTDPVWEVRWADSESSSDIHFYSISSDGRVTSWIVNKTELINEEVVELKLERPQQPSAGGDNDEDGGDDSSNRNNNDNEESKENNNNNSSSGGASLAEDALVGVASGSCFDFSREAQETFVVGTEEGSIRSYSTSYNSQALKHYKGHHMAVYNVAWNSFHPRIFLSCSADWTVKMWELHTEAPILTFDLNNAVGDIAWAPYSSTVFACITADGKLRVFDLSVNKHEPIAETKVVKKAKLTHVAFNPREPAILVGDDRGTVMCLKLSPNLYKLSAPRLEDVDVAQEISRLDKLMFLDEHSDWELRPHIAALTNGDDGDDDAAEKKTNGSSSSD
eukprot:TRINITY_DN66418_c11_g1_i5.p1 TRINITY_DN66418_c11_g1~~TRINITY_DN66418_c11_g1_i5.p1  ORF type:complete len:683 (+),score=390.47 TRINITY_DN66418_c11_g1_i5:191-2239(+)